MHYKDKNLQIDIRCHTVFMNDQKIELSLKEFTVLKYLTEHPGWVFSHEEIYRNVWKEEPIDCANAVMCCISQLRKKLKVDSRNWNYIPYLHIKAVSTMQSPIIGFNTKPDIISSHRWIINQSTYSFFTHIAFLLKFFVLYK